MKKILFTFLLVGYLFTGYAQQNNNEWRATWVITWDLINRYNTVEENKALIRQILDYHVEANMNAVLWHARQGGTAYYPSEYEPWGHYAGGSDPGFDPLGYAIEEAHKRGLEVHAWFNTFAVSSDAPGTIVAEHPNWICRDRDGNAMTSYRAASPGLDSVRDYTVNVAMEIVNNYDVDGLHLDYVRWNEHSSKKRNKKVTHEEELQRLDGMISVEDLRDLHENRGSRYLYDEEHPYDGGVPEGFDSWDDWRRWSVSQFVKQLHDSIQQVKPHVRLSAAALGKYKAGGSSGWNGYYIVFQDAALWFNEGWLDQLTPMHYHWTTGSAFKSTLESDWGPNIQEGIAAGRLYTVGPGSYLLPDYSAWDNHPDIVNKCRELDWVDGFQFFSYESWRSQNYWEEAKETFFQTLTKTRAIPTTQVEIDAPSLDLAKIDELNYTITITPSLSLTFDHWHITYRSEDDVLDIDNDEIIDIHFGNDEYVLNQAFTGYQNYEGTYNYFAVAADRYWRTSPVSTTEETEFIPSYDPTVVSTNPAENGEIFNTDPIIIEFSKEMNQTEFENHISFNPAVTISSVSWAADKKTATVVVSDFEHETEYTMTIAATATDVIGKQLDGDGNGQGGDDFVLNFSTAGDNIPPAIEASHPQNDASDFDVADIINIVFDEEINPATLDDSKLHLADAEGDIAIQHILVTTDDRKSVISIQSEQELESNTNYTVTIDAGVEDIFGNATDGELTLQFTTSDMYYYHPTIIESFENIDNWWSPDGSGSTTGILSSETSFALSDEIYLPASDVQQSAKLSYMWDTDASAHLIREYTPDQTVYFYDTTYLQTYVYGDGSGNKVRFAIDELTGSEIAPAAGDHEVSKWLTLDFYGWRLMEWDLSDPDAVGTWFCDEILTGDFFRIDSYQMTKGDNGNVTGAVYFDQLRFAVKSVNDPYAGVNDLERELAGMGQNFPNPFSQTTEIRFALTQPTFTQLNVYTIQGQKVETLISNHMNAGKHAVLFDGSDLESGIYIYELKTENTTIRKKMVLNK